MNLPVMTQVNSSMIAAIGYDAGYKWLYVRFNKGKTYRYDDVPQSTYNDMMNSDSVGKFFLSHVKPHHVATLIED